MTITMNHRAFSALAKVDTTDLKHAERLQAFGKALGFDSGAALMALARDDVAHAYDVISAREASPVDICDQDAVPDDTEILAHLWTHDYVCDYTLDAREWLMGLTPLQFKFLVEQDFEGRGVRGLIERSASTDDRIYYFTKYMHSPLNEEGPSAYSIKLNRREASRWLFDHRPDLYEVMLEMRQDNLWRWSDVDVERIQHDVMLVVDTRHETEDVLNLVGRYRVSVQARHPVSLSAATAAAYEFFVQKKDALPSESASRYYAYAVPVPPRYEADTLPHMDTINL